MLTLYVMDQAAVYNYDRREFPQTFDYDILLGRFDLHKNEEYDHFPYQKIGIMSNVRIGEM